MLGKENLLSIKSTENGWREFTPQEIHDKSSSTVLYGWTSPNTNIYPPTGSISNDKVAGESFIWLYTSFALDGDVTNLGFGQLGFGNPFSTSKLYFMREGRELETFTFGLGFYFYGSFFDQSESGESMRIYIGTTPPKRKIKRTLQSWRILSC